MAATEDHEARQENSCCSFQDDERFLLRRPETLEER